MTCPAGALDAGESRVCRADRPYTITDADVTAGAVVNTATATGTPPGQTVPVMSDPSTTRTPTEAPAPALSLVKSASPPQAGKFIAGEKVTYSFVITNTGNVPLHHIAIAEKSFSGTGTMSAVKCRAVSLAVGQQGICTAAYRVTAADAFAGDISNEATASGLPPGSATPVHSGPSGATVPTFAHTSISLVKTASPASVRRAGQLVTYSFRVKNTGNVDLSRVAITERAFSGTGGAPVARCPDATLLPGQIQACTAAYPVTQADIDAGKPIINTATAGGIPPAGSGGLVSSPPSSATVTVHQRLALALTKSADLSTVTAAGETITYAFTITNTGNVTLTGVTAVERAFSGSGRVSAVSCPAPAGSLGPRHGVTCTATYVVSRADLARRALTNTAVATGGRPRQGGPVTSAPSTARVTVTAVPHLPVVSG